ncbi:hypothetical protein FRC07_003191 [Ceratobasidium sp. 392]|nr:hypothetical protein FRC07_003191 [Ceratobasidium sp. 392]
MSLIGVLGLVTLIYLPRTIARYNTKSTLREGWMLLRGDSRYLRARLSTALRDKSFETPNESTVQYPPSMDIAPAASTMSHANGGLLYAKRCKGSGPPPHHVRGYLSRVPALARVLEYYILGYRVEQLTILAAYLGLMCVAMFYQSHPASNVTRAGYVAMSQMPIVFALGTKNSVITALTGISYERVWKHQPVSGVPFVATCIALYGADQLARLAKTRLCKAVLEPVPELGSTHMYIPGLDKGWVAGQHVRIRVLSFGLGIFGWTEPHPFTVANAGNDVSGGLSLVCKKAGNWTSALYRMASERSNGDEHRSVYVLVEGPYGGPGHSIIPSFSGVMLVLGGSGITFGTSVLEDLVAKSLDGTARTVCINLVWVVQHPSAADPHLPSFVEIVQRAATVPNLQLTLSVFYTRGSDSAFALRTTLPSNIKIRTGRPDLGEELREVLQATWTSIATSKSSRNGVLLAGCGPEGLISSIYVAKAWAPAEVQKAVGGLELHTETFGW